MPDITNRKRTRSYQKGDTVKRTGTYKLHAGETVVPKGRFPADVEEAARRVAEQEEHERRYGGGDIREPGIWGRTESEIRQKRLRETLPGGTRQLRGDVVEQVRRADRRAEREGETEEARRYRIIKEAPPEIRLSPSEARRFMRTGKTRNQRREGRR